MENEALARALDHIQTNEPVRSLSGLQVAPHGKPSGYALATLVKILESRALVRWIPRVGWVANYQGPTTARPGFIAETYNRAQGWTIREAR